MMRMWVMLMLAVANAQAVGLLDWYAAAPWTPAGTVYGNAVDLDGSTEYLSDASTNAYSSCTSITVSAWVRPSSLRSYDGIVFSRGSGNKICGIIGGVTTNTVLFYIGLGAAQNSTVSLPCLYVNTWTHLCGTWSSGSRPRIYADGVYSNNSSAVPTGTMTLDGVFRIGFESSTASRKFTGLIDEASIWTRALSSNEVAELYNNGLGKRTEQLSTGTNGLIRLWHLDESGSDSNAYDSASGTYATGTAIGTGDWVPGKVPQ